MNGHECTHDRGDETVVAGADDEDVDVLGVGTGGHVLALSGGHGEQREGVELVCAKLRKVGGTHVAIGTRRTG